MVEDYIECEFFTVTSIDSLLAHNNKHDLQVYMDYCAYKTINKQMIEYVDENLFEGKTL